MTVTITKKDMQYCGLILFVILISFGVYKGLNKMYFKYKRYEAKKIKQVQDANIKDNNIDKTLTKASAYFDNRDTSIGAYDPHYFEYNAYLGFTAKPNQKSDYPGGFVINSNGWRYPEDITPEKEQGEVRIFITGGSVAWGLFTLQQNVYFTITENILRQKCNKKIKVISTGLSSYESTQELIQLTNNISMLKPDYVIQFSGFNNMLNFLMSRFKPKNFDRFDFGSRLKQNGTMAEDGQHKILYGKIEAQDSIFWQNEGPKIEDFKDAVSYNIALKKYDIETERRFPIVLDINENNTKLMNIVTKGLNANFIYILQPTILTSLKKRTPFEEQTYQKFRSFHSSNKTYNRYYTEWRKRLNKLSANGNFKVYDADDAIQNIKATAFIDDVHFGDYGNKSVGEYIAYTVLLEDLRSKGYCNQ